MAKVLVQNTREHSIHINIKAGKNQEAFTTVVPGARGTGDEKTNGQVLIDDSILAEAKKHPVVGHYFKQGYLRVEEPAKKSE